jgi:hypothetical protein
MPAISYSDVSSGQAGNPLFHRLSVPMIADMEKKCGVYFLWLDDELQYIGGTTNLQARIDWHRRASKAPSHRWYSGMTNRIQFNRVTTISCEPETVHEVEYRYIRAMQPRMNRRGK